MSNEIMKKNPEKVREYLSRNSQVKILWNRLGRDPKAFQDSSLAGINGMAQNLQYNGGFQQQNRMIQDKRRSLDKAVLYSYQAALIRKYIPDNVQAMDGERNRPPVRALINPDKLKQDYDNKIVSVGYEFNFQPGDVFEWCNTNTYWLIYLQDLEELAYFRGEIRRCSYQISWDDDGETKSTYVAVQGPVETRINYLQKHQISVDTPNYSLNILMPLNEDTIKQFKRYSKFYLQGALSPDKEICWRVETTDSISTPGILQVVAVEYYSNEQEDDIEKGIAGALIAEPIDPNPSTDSSIIFITGDTFIKPKKEYIYSLGIKSKSSWEVDKKYPVKLSPFEDSKGFSCVKLKWDSTYSGQFVLRIGKHEKTIVVESLF